MTDLHVALWREYLKANAGTSTNTLSKEPKDMSGAMKTNLEHKTGKNLIPVDVYNMIDTIIDFEVRGDKDGWSHLPGDDGGATMWGIASNYASPDIAKKVLNRSLTRAEAVYYLYQHYYLMIKEPHLYDRRILFILLDSKIHGGYGTIRTLQQILNAQRGSSISTDGVLGPQTIAALRALRGEEVEKVLIEFKRRIPSLAKQMANHELREQARLGLPRQDFTAGFESRLRFRISTAEQQV